MLHLWGIITHNQTWNSNTAWILPWYFTAKQDFLEIYVPEIFSFCFLPDGSPRPLCVHRRPMEAPARSLERGTRVLPPHCPVTRPLWVKQTPPWPPHAPTLSFRWEWVVLSQSWGLFRLVAPLHKNDWLIDCAMLVSPMKVLFMEKKIVMLLAINSSRF